MAKSKNVQWKDRHLHEFEDRQGLTWRATLTSSNDGRNFRSIIRASVREDGSELQVGGCGLVIPNNVQDIKQLIKLLSAFLPKDKQ